MRSRRSLLLLRTVRKFPIRHFSHSRCRQQTPWLESARERAKSLANVSLLERTDAWKTRANLTLSQLGGRLNEVTGYHTIEELKRSVVEKEQEISRLKEDAHSVKLSYEEAVLTRSACQREINDLLPRKSNWSESDVSHFTNLVRQDHVNAQAEVTAKKKLDDTERKLETAFDDLMRSILNRYHEEQIWSDKIRSASTYGQLLALALNLVVFIAAIIVVEPYKRKRLRESLEDRIELLEKANRQLMEEGMKNINEHFANQEEILTRLATAATSHRLMSADDSPPSSLPPAEVQLPWTSYQIPIYNPQVWSAAAGAVGGIIITLLLKSTAVV
ncbi:Mdm33 family-domain-containing protein [Cantharellus anzutake]|uniref:Mdm33 family-domain-containing protein n=1 Tax=Cantharellus anzutake TaxID=1750568 RepID=UPI0019089B9A|nr:Mdm33 family-domain-containing protein [Cantharellus anzutake]KAF8333494.1 Mdm33 family-domain-containing protein [Cantharellus anzutake]